MYNTENEGESLFHLYTQLHGYMHIHSLSFLFLQLCIIKLFTTLKQLLRINTFITSRVKPSTRGMQSNLIASFSYETISCGYFLLWNTVLYLVRYETYFYPSLTTFMSVTFLSSFTYYCMSVTILSFFTYCCMYSNFSRYQNNSLGDRQFLYVFTLQTTN